MFLSLRLFEWQKKEILTQVRAWPKGFREVRSWVGTHSCSTGRLAWEPKMTFQDVLRQQERSGTVLNGGAHLGR
ncbi:putative heparinase superfamily protein [Bradyrhizobium ottawaense]